MVFFLRSLNEASSSPADANENLVGLLSIETFSSLLHYFWPKHLQKVQNSKRDLSKSFMNLERLEWRTQLSLFLVIQEFFNWYVVVGYERILKVF